jgi:lysophospholipase L1-like esterase
MAGTLDTLGGMDNLDVNAINTSLQESLDETRSHHAQLILLVLASKDQKANDLHPFQKAMLDFAAANQVPVVNMVEVLSANAPADFYMDPVHPTSVGHKIIADQLYNVIRGLPVYTAACQQQGVSVANSAITNSAAAAGH